MQFGIIIECIVCGTPTESTRTHTAGWRWRPSCEVLQSEHEDIGDRPHDRAAK